MTRKVTRDELGLNDIDPGDKQKLMDAVQRGITRREMLTMLGAAGITAASAGNLFTAAGQALAAMPKKGGSVRFASNLHGPSDALDPQLGQGALHAVDGFLPRRLGDQQLADQRAEGSRVLERDLVEVLLPARFIEGAEDHLLQRLRALVRSRPHWFGPT